MLKNQKGFTLIELLVLISIIALLSSVVLASLNSARMKARDTKRIEDLKQIQTALEMYRNDQGKYPSSKDICKGDEANSCQSTNATNWNNLGEVIKLYINSLPIDPLNKGGSPWQDLSNYSYVYMSGGIGNTGEEYCADGSCYDLITNLEDTNSPYKNAIKNYFFYADNKSWLSRTALKTSQIYSPQN